MAKVNFSVPNDIKQRFNQIFANQNKSHLLAELMEEAIEREELKKRRMDAIEALLNLRKKQPAMTQKKIRAARHKGRTIG